DGANPLEGVEVTLSGSAQPAFTNAEGVYNFPAVIAGTYSVQFDLFGYATLVIEDVVVEEDTLTIQDAVLTPVPQYTVTGSVQGNDGNLIEGAEIILEGYTPNTGYSVVSQADGAFTIEDVYEGMYLISVNAFGYTSYFADNVLVDGDVDLGVILLEEQIEAPFNLMVMKDGLEPGQALFSWNNPLTGWVESFEEGILPDEWSQIVTNSGTNAGLPATWTITGPVEIYNTTIDPQDGNYQVFMMWDFSEQDEWLITREFTVPAGDLKFWYYGYTGSTFGDNYYVKISTDDGQSWEVLWNASNLPYGQNFYQAPATINLDMYAGQKARLAWQNEDGPGNFGMWYYWAIDNITIGDAALNLTELMTVADPQNEGLSNARPLAKSYQVTTFGPEDLNGFNVFLDGEQVATGVTSTQFLFDGLADGEYTAGVQAVFTTGVSEIAEIDFVVDDTRLLVLVANPAGTGLLLGSAWYQPGVDVLVNAIPNDGYEFINWTYTNGEVVSEQPSFFFTMPDEDVILIANFEEFETFLLTFSIDMTNAEGMDPENGMVNITGSMHGWAVLGGVARDQALMRVDNSMIYTITMALPAGDYSYAYFMNSGENPWEWEEIPNRLITLNSDMEVFDTWGLTLSIDTPEDKSTRLYPNPFNEQIILHDAGWATRVVITNLMGNEIMNEPLNSERINTGNLSSGVYLVFLFDENGRQVVRKMVKK
ncbi:MAG: carboxypeptidase regulatory-like domain-containing protein, partial [Bacteroidales bacterium]|nr:carboxypeptidase regulatory-like domain-containing protein [Bacteroidales bacterium]